MLLISHIVKQSTVPGAGLGVFATEAIPAGTLVFAWDESRDYRFSTEEWNQLPERYRSYLYTYAWRSDDEWFASGGDGRYVCHSDCPNVGADGRALRDIASGEELFEDYSQYDDEWSMYGHTMFVHTSRS